MWFVASVSEFHNPLSVLMGLKVKKYRECVQFYFMFKQIQNFPENIAFLCFRDLSEIISLSLKLCRSVRVVQR